MTFNLPRVEDTELFTWLRMLVEQIELGTVDDEKVRKFTTAIADLTDELKALRTEVMAISADLTVLSTGFTALSSQFGQSSVTDLDDIAATGLYYVGGSPANAPATGKWVIVHFQNEAETYKEQLAIKIGGSALYSRGYSSTWSQWAQI